MAFGSGAEFVRNLRVSADYFATLGFVPERGRSFTRKDEQQGAPLTVVLSHGLSIRIDALREE